eukprot:TRINITY_DN10259_c0_g1_i1.p1 TRINITY_DN10259_c0_g1~~TRINITY_DN10259_c0_g1_i1.p1  ORF type:complete len:2101 (+),score=705.34 TRINITY_DN10259_c0_g1_i1:133-6435(+)
MKRLPVALLLASVIHGGDAQYVEGGAGETCFTDGNFLIQDKNSCLEAGKELGGADLTVLEVDAALSTVTVGGCFWDVGESGEKVLRFNSYAMSYVASQFARPLCITYGERESESYRRLAGSTTCTSLGETTLLSPAECQAAASELFIVPVITTIASYQYPPGCYLDLVMGSLYYNTMLLSSSVFVGSSPICEKTSEEITVKPTETSVGYVKLGGQQSCIAWGSGIIQTPAECSKAAAALGMNSTVSMTPESEMFSRPPGCYFDIWQTAKGLHFNSFVSSTAVHIHSAPVCEYIGEPNYDLEYIQFTAGYTCDAATGYTGITSLQDCLAAATALGFHYTEAKLVPQSEALYGPPGCFVTQTTIGTHTKGLYYNTFANGYPGVFDSPICAIIKNQSGYHRTDLGQTCNDTNLEPVGTIEECQYAFQQLNFKTTVQIPAPDMSFVSPKGCFIYFSGVVPTLYFNYNTFAKDTSNSYIASICRHPIPLSYTVDQKKTTNDFYFGLNSWAAENEETVYKHLPGPNGLRIIRWGNLIRMPTDDAPIDLHLDQGKALLRNYIKNTYKGTECSTKEYADMLSQRGAKILATMFGAPRSYSQTTVYNGIPTYILLADRINDWAQLLAESVWYVNTVLKIKIDYLELTNEPNGLWDTYVSPTNYVALLKATSLALRERGINEIKLVGPGVSDLGSSLICIDPVTNKALDYCYMQTIQADTEALNLLDAFSMHPWDDVYNSENKGSSFLDNAFMTWNTVTKGYSKQLIITEWSGLNLNTMPLGGQTFDSVAARCYVEPTGSNNTKKTNNIATSPLWAARAFANLLIMVNNGVTDGLYWMTKDLTWSDGCLGLYDRAGLPSEMYKVLETFLTYWPLGVAKAVARSWPSGIVGRSEDLIIASVTDECRMVIGVANIFAHSVEFELDIEPKSSKAEVLTVTTYNNDDKIPVVVIGKQKLTLGSYATMTVVVDDASCSKHNQAYTAPTDSARQDGYAIMLWGGLALIIFMSACYKTAKSGESKETTLYDAQSPVTDSNEENLLDTNYTDFGVAERQQQPDTGRAAFIMRFVVLGDIIVHAILLTEGGTTTGKFGVFTADIREMGRLVTDAWVIHAVRLGFLGACYWASSTSLINKYQVYTFAKPVYFASIALLMAKARVRIGHYFGEVCWFDLDVESGTEATPSMWFWTMLLAGTITAVVELYFMRLIGKKDEPAKPKGPQFSAASKKTMDALDSLRFLAAVHIVVYHFHASRSHVWDVFASWGATQLTFFFMLSGFVLSYQYGDREIDQTDFWFKRAVRLYPLYAASCLLGLFVMPGDAFNVVDTICIFAAVQKWTGPAINYINTPGWAVGPFLLLYVMYPSMRDIILTVSAQKRSNVLLPCLYVLSAMAAMDALNENWTGVFAPLNHIFLSAHIPSFLAGTVLGLNYLESHKDGANAAATMRDVVAVPGALLVCIAIWCTVDLSDEHADVPFWHEWARFGMFQPVFGVVLWYGGRGHDFISKALSWGPITFLGRYSFTLYLLQAPLHNTFQKYLSMPYPLENWSADAFLFLLLATSFVVFEFFEEPARIYLLKSWRTIYPSVPNVLEHVPNAPEFVKILGYYFVMALIFFMFIMLAVFGTSTILRWEGNTYAFSIDGDGGISTFISAVKWLALTSLPVAVIGLAGHVLFPPCRRKKVPSLEAMLQSDGSGAVPCFKHKLHFRIVTRGKHPLLVLENVEKAARVLESCLPREKYEVEVVTDNDMQLQSRTSTPVTEIVVPHSYKCPSGAKFKARALEYAIHNSSCTPDDWIIHQDEETRFDVETVQHVYYHCAMEQKAVDEKKREFGRIGQGIILYGVNDEIENWMTTLADSIRVADDFGKFRLQFEMHEPLIGMHGSFVVASQKVEEATTFDHGMAGSVTEDAYFALVARALGVTFSYIDAYMYEQSPFSILDFAKQRKRWFAGLWLVAKAPGIPLKYRLGLFLLEVQWGWAPLMLPAALLVLGVKTNVSMEFRVILAAVSAYWCWAYVVGFLFTFSIRKLGVCKYFVLLWLQLILQPFFALMEVWGVGYALVDREAFKGFHVVQKESAALKARMGEREASPIPVVNESVQMTVQNGEEEDIEIELKPLATAE